LVPAVVSVGVADRVMAKENNTEKVCAG